jgi:periplasmic nitrate reductase NapD
VSETLHIASLVIQHPPGPISALQAAIAADPCSEIVASQGSRSVVLCEGSSEHDIVKRMEGLRDVSGVMSVSLIHHHAEARDTLLEEIVDADPS